MRVSGRLAAVDCGFQDQANPVRRPGRGLVGSRINDADELPRRKNGKGPKPRERSAGPGKYRAGSVGADRASPSLVRVQTPEIEPRTSGPGRQASVLALIT